MKLPRLKDPVQWGANLVAIASVAVVAGVVGFCIYALWSMVRLVGW